MLSCPRCGNEVSVPEYANNIDTVVCSSCEKKYMVMYLRGFNDAVNARKGKGGAEQQTDNTTQPEICRDTAEKIFSFIYENTDTPVIDPDYLKQRLADIIAANFGRVR